MKLPDGASTQPIIISPYDVYLASRVFAVGQNQLEGITSSLSDALAGCGGMAGNDENGQAFGHTCDPVAAAVIKTLSASIPVLGQMAQCLVATANNYLKAEHHSTAAASALIPEYPLPGLTVAVAMPPPPSAIGPGSSGLPSFLAKYWPNGHQDLLRNAAAAFSAAADQIEDLGSRLHSAVASITDNNSAPALDAMSEFFAQLWSGAGSNASPLDACLRACRQLAQLCERYASALDSAHLQIERAMVGAGIAVGLTTAVGAVFSFITGGGSDAAAGWADAQETAAILGPIASEFTAAVSADLEAAYLDEIVPILDSATDSIPDLTAVDAETTPIGRVLDAELDQSQQRELVGVGSRGARPGAGNGSGGGMPLGAGDGAGAWQGGGDDPGLVADKIAAHADEGGHGIEGVDDADLPGYLEQIMRQPGYKLRPSPGGLPRMLWWDGDTDTVLIRTGNEGTFFQPDTGYQYVLREIAQ